MQKFTKYNKKSTYSYTLGAFPTIELIKTSPKKVIHVFIHSSYKRKEELIKLLDKLSIPYSIENKTITRLSKKENVYLLAIFEKKLEIAKKDKHIVLENIQDMGNLGTIIRTMLAFGIKDLISVGNESVDIFNPKVVRASMGAIFKIRHRHYDTMKEYYMDNRENRKFYFFRLDEKASKLHEVEKTRGIYSLVFGNEGSGLLDNYHEYGKSIFIDQTDQVDSLNLPISVAIGLYEFERRSFNG